jgi:ribonuclease P protein component
MCAAVPTLKTSPDFQRIARSGKKWVAPAFILQIAKTNEGQAFRLGLTASRKVGNAVIRNRAKRRLREMVRVILKDNPMTGIEIVLIAKTAAADYDFTRMTEDFKKGIEKLS